MGEEVGSNGRGDPLGLKVLATSCEGVVVGGWVLVLLMHIILTWPCEPRDAEHSSVPQASRQGSLQCPWRHKCVVVPQSASLRHRGEVDLEVVVVGVVEGVEVSVSVNTCKI